MKYIIIAVIVMGVGVIAVSKFPATMEVVNNTATTTVEVQVDVLENRIKEAQDAERGAIEIKAKAAYDASIAKELKKIEDKVKTEYISEIEKSIDDVSY
jgi:Tfp pilus assembly protein PilV